MDDATHITTKFSYSRAIVDRRNVNVKLRRSLRRVSLWNKESRAFVLAKSVEYHRSGFWFARNFPQASIVSVTNLILNSVKLGELSTGAEWRIDLRGIVEERVIDLVSLPFLRIRHHRLESVTPEYLLRQVAGSCLSGLPGGFDGTLEDDHDLESIGEHVLGGKIVERRLGVDFVDDGGRPDKEEIAVLAIGANGQFLLILRQDLAFFGGPRSDNLSSDRGTDDMAFPHVTDAEHQAQFSVPLTDHGVLRKQQSLRPLLRPAHLRENDTDHERLYHNPGDTLYAHYEDRFRAFLGR